MLKKFMGILLALILIVSLLPLSAFADGENGLVYQLTTDKSKYSKTEDITVTLTVTNKNSDGASYSDVKLVNKVPSGYTLKKGSSIEKSIPVLAPGESAKLVSVFQPVYYPPTGDPGIGLTLLAGVIAVLGMIFLLSGKKGRYMNIFRSMMCLMMVLSLVTMILPQTAVAASVTLPVTKTVKVADDELKISSYVTYEGIIPLTSGVFAQDDGHGTATVTANGKAVKTADAGTSLAFKAVPKDGYEFDYWEVTTGDIDIGSVKNNASIAITMPGTALALTAHFKEAIGPYSSIYAGNDGHGTATVTADGKKITTAGANMNVTFSAEPDDGYEFDYWEVSSGEIDIESIKNNATITVKMIKEPLVLTAHFKEKAPVTYAITVQNDGNGTAKAQVNSADADAAEAGAAVQLIATPNSGYQFKEWSVVSGAITITDDKFTMPAEDVSVQAVFEKQVNVSFDLNGIDGTAPDTQSVAVNGKVTKPSDPTDKVHTFTGWYKTKDQTTGVLSDKWDFNTDTVTEDTTLYAQWSITVQAILQTNTDLPSSDDGSIPASPWTESNDPDLVMYRDNQYRLYIKARYGTHFGYLADDPFVKVGNDYVGDFSGYGVLTCHMEGGVFTSADYDGTGTSYAELTGSYSTPACIAAGTMISMPDGKQKAVEELEIGDVICTFDHETGKVSSAPVAFIWESKNAGNAFTLTFEDGTAVTVIQEHGFFDQEEQQYAFINQQNAEEYIGHHFYNADSNSWLELKSCEVLNHSVDAYDIVTSGDFNHMANGLLAIGDGTEKMFANLFAFDDQMKFDADKKKADIETYGLTPKEKVLELEGFTESEYDTYNLQYLDILIGKGIVTWEQMEALSDYCVENGF